ARRRRSRCSRRAGSVRAEGEKASTSHTSSSSLRSHPIALDLSRKSFARPSRARPVEDAARSHVQGQDPCGGVLVSSRPCGSRIRWKPVPPRFPPAAEGNDLDIEPTESVARCALFPGRSSECPDSTRSLAALGERTYL